MANRRGWLALAVATLPSGCFPYSPAELRPSADTPAPPLAGAPPLPKTSAGMVRALIGLPPGTALDGTALDGTDAPFRGVPRR